MGADCDSEKRRVQMRNAREERFLSAQADAFAGANAEEKSRPAPFEMTGGGRGRHEEVGPLGSK